MIRYVLPCLALLFISFSVFAAERPDGWGKTVGPVSATVAKADDQRGLSLRPRPSGLGRPLGYLAVGTRIKGFARFRDGWMQVRGPSGDAWVDMTYLEPLGGAATVTNVDRRRGCAPIRRGPSASHDVLECVEKGQSLELSGVWSDDFRAQTVKPVKGWINASHIRSDVVPYDRPGSAVVERPSPSDRRGSYAREKDPVGDRREPEKREARPRPAPRRPPGPPGPPGHGVHVNTGPVGVSVGPHGGVGVRVFGIRIGVAPGGGVNVNVGP